MPKLRSHLGVEGKASIWVFCILGFSSVCAIEMSTLTLGITFNTGEELSQLIGGSGLNQNVMFLYDLFHSLGHDVYMILDESEFEFIEIEGKQYKTKSATEIIQQGLAFDIVFEAGLGLIQRDRFFFREHCGARIVCVRYGNSLFLDMERLFVKGSPSSDCHHSKPEMVWISPHFDKSIYYIEALYQARVELAPFIWEPVFVPKKFDPSETVGPLDVVVMEPNTSVLKNALIPLAILNEVCREAPEAFEKATILNSLDFYNEPYFLNNVVQNLTYLSSQKNKVFFAGRFRIFDVFQKADVMLAFQHYNGLNYLYMEALYMGVPLVHNSPYYLDVGYYYPEFNVRIGKKKLMEALKNHDPQAADVANTQFLEQFSVNNERVKNRYQELLNDVMVTPRVTSL
ncbi:MAG: DUF2827 family protein [Gammaproteobacteria bacterium]|nr:DUF2827 family protein [Gammaproteobacteria bacterium]